MERAHFLRNVMTVALIHQNSFMTIMDELTYVQLQATGVQHEERLLITVHESIEFLTACGTVVEIEQLLGNVQTEYRSHYSLFQLLNSFHCGILGTLELLLGFKNGLIND